MALADKRLQCREIITKAVCGKGRKFSTVTHSITPPHPPSSILGAWIINHQYEAVKSGDGVEIIGSYDINVWYSYDRNTQTDVAKETVTYSELVPLTYLDPKHRKSTEEVTAEAIQEPNCVEASIQGRNSVAVRVEREFAVEMIAETKVCVAVCPGGCQEDGKDAGIGVSMGEDGYEDLDADLLEDEV